MRVAKLRSKRDLIWRVATGVWLVGMLVFIFGNSMKTGEVSGNASHSLCDAINRLLALFGDLRMDEYLLRKLAHFIEFCLLGMAAGATQLLHFVPMRPRIVLTVSASLCVAVADELFQFTAAGRTPRVTDVLIDLLGILAGVLLVNGLRRMYKARKGGRQHESKSGV